jgi:Apoptogenic protein 1
LTDSFLISKRGENYFSSLQKCFVLPVSPSNIRLFQWRIQTPASADTLSHEYLGELATSDLTSQLHPWQLTYLREEQALCEFNHDFWLAMNTKFITEKSAYIVTQHTTELDDEAMAIFYERYLTDNKPIFQAYHQTWWRRNWALLWLSCKATLSKFIPSERIE